MKVLGWGIGPTIRPPKLDLIQKSNTYNYYFSVGCHCNAAGYFIGMPGPAGGEGGDWYCDANFVGGQW